MFPKKLIRETQVDNGRTIRVYDDVFDMEYRHSLYSFAQSSTFRIGWADSLLPENKAIPKFLHSTTPWRTLRVWAFLATGRHP
jgi:hypothetical protein